MVRLIIAVVFSASVMMTFAAVAAAPETIPWTGDLKSALKAAERDGKLVLLHFYSDNCPPCRTLERNVFSQAEIASAITRNYIPVKVHVDTMPLVAQRYQIEAWPTDVIVTSAGLEVFRTISPQAAGQYLTMLDQVAFQSGIGAGRLPGGNALSSSTGYGRRSSVSLAAATSPAGAAATPPATPAVAAGAEQGVQVARQQAEASVNNPYAAQRAPGQTYAAAPQRPRQPAQPAGQAASRPALAPQLANPADHRPLQTAAAVPPVQSIYADPQESFVPAAVPQADRQAAVPQRAAAPSGPPGIYDQVPAQQGAPARHPPQPSRPATHPGQRATAQFQQPQFVDASRAPPLSLDGFCPVTILESGKWRKGNVQFGAVHRGRTYLFASPEAQQRFLADPDRFAPLLSGCDPVVFAETQQWVSGKNNIGLLLPGGRTVFFTSEETLARFKLSPQAYLAHADQALVSGQTQIR